jgi:hypothetical protein
MQSYRLVALSSALPGREEEYERWYDEQHIPDCLKLEGFQSAQRFRVGSMKSGVDLPAWQLITIYEIESDDIDTTMGQIAKLARTPAMRISEAFDIANSLLVTAVAAAPRAEKAPA